MRICGIEISGSTAFAAIIDVETTSRAWTVVDAEPAKIPLGDEWDANEVRRVAAEVTAFLSTHAVERVVIKKQTKGAFASGPPAHRLATLFQLGTKVDVEFLSSQTIDKRTKELTLPEDLRKYQHGAARAAIASFST